MADHAPLLQPRLATDLPPPRQVALDLARGMQARGGTVWIDSAQALLGDRAVLHLARSRSRVDVGAWIGRVRIWVFATPDELVLGAWGGLSPAPEPYERVVPFDDVRTFLYNDVTGHLVLTRRSRQQVPALALEPLDGYQFCAQIEKGCS